MSDKWLKTMNTTWIKPQENYHNLIEYNAAFLFRISFGQSVQVLQYIKKVTKLLPFSIQRIISGLHIICKCFIYMTNYCNFVYTLLICYIRVGNYIHQLHVGESNRNDSSCVTYNTIIFWCQISTIFKPFQFAD